MRGCLGLIASSDARAHDIIQQTHGRRNVRGAEPGGWPAEAAAEAAVAAAGANQPAVVHLAPLDRLLRRGTSVGQEGRRTPQERAPPRAGGIHG
eukprot:scaffold14733_cov108-Isochrysis_galbana.AAC.3